MTGGWGTLQTLLDADGSTTHPAFAPLARSAALARDVADAVHALCLLHGRHPGLLDHALRRHPKGPWSGWFESAVTAFAQERALLAKLASAVGPQPSTPGQAESEATILAQRHALETLAGSDRQGVALGASVALVGDWLALRPLIEIAAERFGLACPGCRLPRHDETATVAAAAATTPAVERAMAFGAQQVLAQHRGLWSLLEARASARNRA
ncbi:MAG: hypothetical protein K2X76_04080 [Sphingomonas sp.]|nr:hypothetical protein [Sphingomonas sp.]